ncbi:MAG TPA: hypothetical protein VIY86_03925, partial [Pirellulaceae bacterium]
MSPSPHETGRKGCLWGATALLGLFALGSQRALAQLPPDPNYVRQPIYATYAEFRAAVNSVLAIADPTQQTQQLDALWSQWRAAGQVPFALGDKVAFLYRGNATSVAWRGDFNSWGTSSGVRQGNTDLWMLERTLPANARTDYKLFLNQRDWLLDPANTLQIWSGFGPNSELRMPEYQFPMETVRRPTGPRGNLSA